MDYPLAIRDILLLKMAIEIVDKKENGDFNHCFVNVYQRGMLNL